MELSLIGLICYLAIGLGVVAIIMLIRDLALPSNTPMGPGMTISGSRPSLRRRPSVFDEAPARSFSGRLDQAFDRLVLETGYGFNSLTGFLMLIACGLLVGGSLWSYYGHFLSGIAGMMIGMIIPLVVMASRRARRLRDVRQQLPSVLDLLARAVRAGESLDQAIALIGSETGGVLGYEFAQCARQMDMGRSVESVMKSLALRIRLIEMRILATTLTVHRQAGGNLADALERMSGVVRDRINARRQMRASTGAGRSSAMLIATVSPLAYLIMFLWQPEHVKVLYDDSLGAMLLAIAFILEIAGIIWVLALLRNEA